MIVLAWEILVIESFTQVVSIENFHHKNTFFNDCLTLFKSINYYIAMHFVFLIRKIRL